MNELPRTLLVILMMLGVLQAANAQQPPRKPRIEDTINAKEFTKEQVGPKEPFFEHDFKGAKFIWSDDVKLDNLVLFRTVVKSPPDGKDRPDFRGLTDVVPQRGGGVGGRRGGGGNRGQRGSKRSN